MKTKQFISTICYSDSDWMIDKLNKLVNSSKIDFWCFIEHQPEEDEKKAHKHLLVIPCVSVDTRDLDDFLAQPKGEESLGTCKLWHTVGKKNISDFLLYGLHEPLYLRIKGYADRKFTYKQNEFYSSSDDALQDLFFQAYHDTTFAFNTKVLDALRTSDNILQTGKEFVLNGYIPLNSTCSFHHLLQIIGG